MIVARAWPLLIGLLGTLHAGAVPFYVTCPAAVGSSPGGPSAAVASIRFDPSDFTEAPNWAGRGHPRFPLWAADQANLALAALRESGARLDAIVRDIARERAKLEAEIRNLPLNHEDVSEFGKFRFNDRGNRDTPLGSFIPGLGHSIPERLRPLAMAIIEANKDLLAGRSFESWLDSLKSPETMRSSIVGVDYIGIDGHSWPASTLILNENPDLPGLLIIMHPTGTNARYIYADSLARASALLRGETPAQRGPEFEFGLSMNSFFQAMPTYRGSAAIGRVFFAALGAHLFHRKPAIPPDADLKAMYMRPLDYAKRFADGTL